LEELIIFPQQKIHIHIVGKMQITCIAAYRMCMSCICSFGP